MFDKESIIVGQKTRIKLLTMKHPIYDVEGNLLGYLVRQPKSVAYYYESQLGTILCEIRMESKEGFASSLFIYDSSSQMKGFFIGGGSKSGWYKTTENPITLMSALGQTIAISDSYTYERGLVRFEAAKRGGLTIRDSFGEKIVEIHRAPNIEGVQVDFLDQNVDKLLILAFIAIEITDITLPGF